MAPVEADRLHGHLLGAIILLTYGVEWSTRHAVALSVASTIVVAGLIIWILIRWRRRQYW